MSPDRIVSAFRKRVAPEYPPDAHGSTLECPVFCNGIYHVLGTGRLIFAVRADRRRNVSLIPANQRNQCSANHIGPSALSIICLGLFRQEPEPSAALYHIIANIGQLGNVLSGPVCEYIIIARRKLILKFPEGLAHKALHPVPSHGSKLAFVSAEPCPDKDGLYFVTALPGTRVSLHCMHRQELPRSEFPVTVHARKFEIESQRDRSQTAICFLPFALLLARTLRPFAVSILALKP